MRNKFPTPRDVISWLKVDVHLGVERTMIDPKVLLAAMEELADPRPFGPLTSKDPAAFVAALMKTASSIQWTTAKDGVQVSALLHEVQNYLLPDIPTGKTFLHKPTCGLADGRECDCGGRERAVEDTP